MTPTLLFLLGTVAVACNGAVIKGRPCDHYRDEEIQAEPVLANIPEGPMLPPFSPSALQFVAPLQEETKTEKPEATASLSTVPLAYQDYAWSPVPIYPSFPVNVLAGQAALDYPNVQIVPITDFTKPESQKKEESLAPIPEAPVLPAFEPAMVLNYSETEKKEELPATPEVSIAAAPMLPSWTALSTPDYMPYPQMDEGFYQQPYNYYPVAQRPCEHASGSSAAATPVLLPFYLPALAPQTESKPAATWYPEAPILPLTNDVAYDEKPAKEEEKVVLMNIPEAPILPPFVAPEMPREEITAAPLAVEMPAQNDAEAPCEKEVELISIPAAPVLPAFVAPELHLSAPMTEAPKPDCNEEPFIQEEATYDEYVPIPEAPVLPAFVASEMPFSAEPEEPAKEEPATKPESLLIIIPEAPVLPAFTAPEALPIAAPMYDEVKPEETPCEEKKEETYENSAPVFIPTAPMLPPFVAPEIPKMEEEKETKPIATEAPAVPEVLCEEPESEPEQYRPIPAAPVLPTFVAPEMSDAPMYDESKYEEPQQEQYISIPAAPVLPNFEMPALPMYEEPKSEDCDKDKEYQRAPVAYPYYLPIPAKYAVSSQSGPALPESTESIAECIRKILANRISPAFYANLIPAAQDMRAPIVPASSPFYYKPAMSNALPVY